MDGLPDGPFDLVTLIYCDFCALSPAQRATLLAHVRDALVPSGSFVLDVHTPAFLASLQPMRAETEHPDGGFFAARPHREVHERVLYPKDEVVLDRFTIIEPDRERVFWNWLACFTPETFAAEHPAAGPRLTEVPGDVAGASYSPAAPEFAAVVTRWARPVVRPSALKRPPRSALAVAGSPHPGANVQPRTPTVRRACGRHPCRRSGRARRRS